MPNSGQFLFDFWGVLSQWRNTHLPTLALGVLAIGLMWGLKKYKPKLPGVLVAVALTTLISWGFGFENNVNGNLAQIKDPALLGLVTQVDEVANRVKDLGQEQSRINDLIKTIQQDPAPDKVALIRAQGELAIVQTRISGQNAQSAQLRKQLAQIEVGREVDSSGATTGIYAKNTAPAGARLQDTRYHVRGISNGAFRPDQEVL
jgi:SulP family sulfate permease